MIKNYALYGLTALVLIGSLTGCGHALSDSTADINTVNYPIVVKYDDATLDKAAAEMDACDRNDPNASQTLCQMVVDYGQMRDETRVLLGVDVNVAR